MEYIASLSYGKDSMYMLEVIHQNNLPLDRIVHVEVMATDAISGDYPEMVEFKKKANKFIKERYGIEVETLRAEKSFEEQFYTKRGKRAKPENVGKIYGFPAIMSRWCNSKLKVSLLKKFDKIEKYTQYIGLALDEPKRLERMKGTNQRAPLAEYGITEEQAYKWCEENDMLSPIYKFSARGGCWFCQLQRIGELRNLRKNYPDFWAMLLKWDEDSPVPFRPNMTVHEYDKRFAHEEKVLLEEEMKREKARKEGKANV